MVLAAAIAAPAAVAQQPAAVPRPVTREQAVLAALASGGAVRLGQADTAAAVAVMRMARALRNPSFGFSYSKTAPQWHAIVDVPLDLPWWRGLRSDASRAGLAAARGRYAFTRASVRYEVEAAYGRALAAAERAALARQGARDADSLLTLARRQRDAGDASDLDVDLATINAGQLANAAAGDRQDAVVALLDLQLLMGLGADAPQITLTDSVAALLALLPDSNAAPAAQPNGVPLRVSAAAAALRSTELGLRLAHRRASLMPSFQFGVEWRDPSGADKGALPVIGVALPLPLFHNYGAEVAWANAERSRAAVELDVAERETASDLARARLALGVARERLTRDVALLGTARAVAARALTAYREGAAALPAVLQAQRAAREAQQQYVEDVVAVATASAAMRLVTTIEGPQ
jgi:cobalt-zinc-cadmium efflux system outer membrane protein